MISQKEQIISNLLAKVPQILLACLMFILSFTSQYITRIGISIFTDITNRYEIPPAAKLIITQPNIFISLPFILSFAYLIVLVKSWQKKHPTPAQNLIYLLYLANWSFLVISMSLPFTNIVNQIS